MKKYLKFSGICAAVLAAIAFILMMATPALKYIVTILGSTTTTNLGGSEAIFGNANPTLAQVVFVNSDSVIPASWNAIIAWILVMAAMAVLVIGFVFPLLKIKALDRFAGVLNLCAVGALVVAGIFMLIEKKTFLGLIGVSDGSYYHLGAGWIIGAIMAFLAAIVAVIPACADFLSKGKKK